MIGLDTSALIDLSKGSEILERLLLEQSAPLAVTEMSYIELLFGVDARKQLDEERYFDELFSALYTFSLDRQSIKKAARVFRHLKQKGKMIDEFDCLIAGIFLRNNVQKIITKNKSHFERIPEIEVITY